MSIPLVQNNDKDSINTSLNAIKRNLDRINSMLGLVDNTTAGMENEIALLQPVDTVASGNLHSVTSNAVAQNNKFAYQLYTNGDVLNIINSLPVNKIAFIECWGIFTNSPYGVSSLNVDFIFYVNRHIDPNYISVIAFDIRSGETYVNSKVNTVWQGWYALQRVERVDLTSVITSGAIPCEWANLGYRNGVYSLAGRFYTSTAITISDGALIGTIRQDLNANPTQGRAVTTHNFQNGQDYLLWFDIDGTIKIYGIGTQTIPFDFYFETTYVR